MNREITARASSQLSAFTAYPSWDRSSGDAGAREANKSCHLGRPESHGGCAPGGAARATGPGFAVSAMHACTAKR